MTKKLVSTTAAVGQMTMTAVARAAALLTMTTGPDNIVAELNFTAFDGRFHLRSVRCLNLNGICSSLLVPRTGSPSTC
jgi:hypothetical protein